MTVQYIHLSYEDYKTLEKQMRAFKETSHRSEGGFYHTSIRLKIDGALIMEFHGPLVGGSGHVATPTPGRAAGGRARAAKLSPARRSDIASTAAKARWGRKPTDKPDASC